MRPGGVQNARLFGEKIIPYNNSTGIGTPGIGVISDARFDMDQHLIRNQGWTGPVKDSIDFLNEEGKEEIGLVRYTAELQTETEIMYTCFFSINKGSGHERDDGMIPEGWRVNVPYKISTIVTPWAGPLLAIDDEKWRIKWALNNQKWLFSDKRTQELIKSATGSIMKIEKNGDPVIIENSTLQ